MFYIRFLRKYVFVFGLILSLILSSCVTSPKLNQPKTSKSHLEQKTYNVQKVSPIDKSQIWKKLTDFKKALNKGRLTKSDWKTHDQLLNAYIQLKSQQNNKVTVPAHGQATVPIETYCLNSGKAAPSPREIYHWQKSNPGIRYFRELFELRRKNKIKQQELQELLWNLQNETRWDNYPNRLKAILQSIDPQASFKLPSKLKDQATSLVKDSLLGLPGASEAINTYNLIEGHYYDFETFKNSVENLTSKHELSDYQNLTRIPGSSLYSQSQSNGFDNQIVTFYNPSDKPQEIDLNEFYLAPERPDVQRIGINRPIDDPTLLTDLEKVLYEDMARLGIGFVPLVNDVADVYELLTGKDFISGKSLSLADRMLSGLGVIAGSGAAYRYAKRAIHSPTQYVDEFSKGLSKASRRTASLTSEKLDSARQVVKQSDSALSNANNLKPEFGNKYVSRLPDLKGSQREAFDGHIFKGEYEPGEILFQAQRAGQKGAGNWFGPLRPKDSDHAESLFNIRRWGNNAEQIKAYVVKERVSGYAGKVAGGEGHQFLIPSDVPLDKVLMEVNF